jgi:serine/threonine protein kinase
VITYFLLCGYTPFDRDSNLEEMQAILAADYSFTPLEYWRGVSQEARDFINRCLTINPQSRMTAHEALQHPWVNPPYENAKVGSGEDLLPTVKKNFNARRTLHRAIDTVRAINKLREGGGFMMDGVMSIDPKPERVNGDETIEEQSHAPPSAPTAAGAGDGGPMQIDSRGNARGQTEEQIRAQERKVKEMVAGLWSRTPR